ncbi:MAG: type I restriction endonuclease subunit R, partial [Clostridia bacterium]|nr:type I restriction endonuclease subunit R [Clostridia bacterium]
AFSRTNRILNSVKTFGNIVCFRNLETATNNALALFGDKNARGMVILKTYNEYMNGYEDNKGKHIEGYNELVNQLLCKFPITNDIVGEDKEKEFIKLFGRILKLKNILRCFDEFESDTSVSVRDLQDYQSVYIDLYQDYTKKNEIEKERINDDIVFEIELIKQVEVNIDYILWLVTQYHKSNCEDKTILANINKSIDASVELRSKKALIEGFVAQMTVRTDVEKDWIDFVKKQKEHDLETIIKDEKLKHDEAQKFIKNSFRDGEIKTTGTDLDKILPPISRFSKGSNRALKKQTVIDKLKNFFEKYFGLV